MAILRIQGGKRLNGEISVSGSKNGALAVMAATLLVKHEVVLHNIPHIDDVTIMVQVLRALGAKVSLSADGTLTVDASSLSRSEAPPDLVRKMRASFSVLGPVLARVGHARVAMPGGCDIGGRPIDFHIQGLESLGARVTNDRGTVDAQADRLVGTRFFLNFPSSGATQQIMAAACLAVGTTVIDNAAREPEVTDVATFLNLCGARISGAGTSTITVEGQRELSRGTEYRIIPDRVEAGTFALAAANTRGNVLIRNAVPEHLGALLQKLKDVRVECETSNEGIHVISNRPCLATRIVTTPYPGFPTDLQQPMGALLATADGPSTIKETVYEHRFRYLDELAKMGADVTTDNTSATIRGVPRLHGAVVTASDLRAGAALVVAALAAEGETEISEVEHIYRGYERLASKLNGLGAEVCTGEAVLC